MGGSVLQHAADGWIDPCMLPSFCPEFKPNCAADAGIESCNLDQLAVKKKRKNGRLFGSMQGYLPPVAV